MNTPEKSVLVGSIQAFFNEYVSNPLYYLREAGLQARLLQLIHQRLEAGRLHETAARVVEERDAGWYVRPDTAGVMARAQVEVRIQPTQQACNDMAGSQTQALKKSGKSAEKSDIAILRRASTSTAPITLTNYPNGPLDIVRLISADDVDAVVELKASVSADVDQRHLFRCDVLKLLELKSRCRPGLSAHFVLVDKSLALKGHDHALGTIRGRPIPWWDDRPKDSENKKHSEWVSSNERLKVVPVGNEEPDDGAGVHVWQLEPGGTGIASERLHCRRYLATMR